jgi:hypothetical protein
MHNRVKRTTSTPRIPGRKADMISLVSGAKEEGSYEHISGVTQ